MPRPPHSAASQQAGGAAGAGRESRGLGAGHHVLDPTTQGTAPCRPSSASKPGSGQAARRQPHRAADREGGRALRVGSAVVPGQDLAEVAGPEGDGAVADLRVEVQEGRNEGWSTADGRRARRLSRPASATSTPTCVVDREGLRMAGHRMAGQAGQRQRGPMPPCGGVADTRRAAQAVGPAAGLDKCVTIWLHVTRWNQMSRSSYGD